MVLDNLHLVFFTTQPRKPKLKSVITPKVAWQEKLPQCVFSIKATDSLCQFFNKGGDLENLISENIFL